MWDILIILLAPRALFLHPGKCSRAHAFDGAVTRMIALASILSVGLFLYLIVALLKPEWFA
jgi:K+-transporting ATPase KdpF subunit